MNVLTWIAEVLGADSYYAHAVCLTNDPLIMLVYVMGDGLTFLSYMIIGSTLWVRRRTTIELSPIAAGLYGAFIFLCGLSHLGHVLVLFSGVYRLDVAIVAAMAGVSVMTAIWTALDLHGLDGSSVSIRS